MAFDPELNKIDQAGTALTRQTSKMGDLERRLTALEQNRRNVLTPVSALPAGFEGQEIAFAVDLADGVVWGLRYRGLNLDGTTNSSSYKWEALGTATPLFNEVETNETCASDAVIRDLATVGPSVFIPLAGDYDFEYGAAMSANGGGAGAPEGYCYLNVGGTTNTSSLCVCGGWNAVSSGTNSGVRYKRLTGLSAGTTVKLVYEGNNTSGSLAVSRRWITCWPVRVG